MGKIKDFFFGKKKETYLVRPPKEVTKELEKEFYTKKFLQQNTALQSENVKLRQELARQKQEKEEEKQLKDIETQILKQKEADKELEKSTTLFIPFKGIRKLPILYTKSDKPLGRCAGFFLKPTREGIVLWYPVVKIKEGLRKLNVYSQNPNRFFRNPLNWSLQVKSGKLDTNIDFTGDGKPVIFEDKDIFEKFIEKEGGEKVRVLMMDESERHDFEIQIANLRDRIKQNISTMQDMAEKEVEYENRINELESKRTSMAKDRDNYSAEAENLRNKDATKTEILAQALSSNQDLKINSVVAESSAAKLLNVTDSLLEKLEAYIPKDKMEMAREIVSQEILKGVEIAKTAQVPTKLMITSEKEEAKKVEAAAKEQEKKVGGILRRR